jgi:hypothetical protein
MSTLLHFVAVIGYQNIALLCGHGWIAPSPLVDTLFHD